MAGYFAELQNNIVQRVVGADNAQWCVDNLGGEWVQTYYATEGKNYAGIGDTYNPVKDNFISCTHFTSWILNEDTCKWEAPIPMPDDGNVYFWNEENLMWEIHNLN
jgi:hypothetical protein